MMSFDHEVLIFDTDCELYNSIMSVMPNCHLHMQRTNQPRFSDHPLTHFAS
jgi:hypothetical protein